MPLLGRKPYQPRRLSESVDPGEEVFVVPETNEAVLSYEEFSSRYDQLHSPIWSCALTGKPGLTYGAALKSEQSVREQLKSFPAYFVGPVLQLVQHNCHSLEYILDDAYDLLHTRFAVGEPVEAGMEPKSKNQVEGRIVAIHEPPPTPPKSADVSRDDGNSAVENGIEGASAEKKEVIKIDDDDDEAEDDEDEPNPTYTVEFFGNPPVIKHGVDSDDITRLKRAPTRDLIKNIIKDSARRVRWSDKNVWVVKDELVKQHSVTSKFPELTFEMVEASLASPGKDRRSCGSGNRSRPSLGGRRNSMKQMTLLDMAAGRTKKDPQTPAGRGRVKTPSVPSSPTKGSPTKSTPLGRPHSPSKVGSGAKVAPQKRPRSPSKSSPGSAEKRMKSPTKATGSRKALSSDALKRKGRPPGSKSIVKPQQAAEAKAKTAAEAKAKSAAEAKAKSTAAKTLKDMLSGVSSLPKASCTRLLNKAAQTLSTPERNSLPLAERKLVEQKLQEHRQKLAWKLLTPEQKKQRRAEERAKLKEKRHLQKLIEKERNKVMDDELLPSTDLPTLPDLPAVPLPDGVSNEVFGDVAMLAEFLYVYHSLISPDQSQHFTAAMLLEALAGGHDGMDVISDIMVSLLKLIGAEQSGHREIGTKLSALPLASQTAPELVRLWLLPHRLVEQAMKMEATVKPDDVQSKDATDSKEESGGKSRRRREKKAKAEKEGEKEEGEEEEEAKSSDSSEDEEMDDTDDEDNEDLSSETVAVLVRLRDTEFRDLAPVEKLQVLVALCHKVLCTEAVQEHLHDQRSQFTKLWRQRMEDSKEIKEKVEREKKEKKQKELEKQQKLMAAAMDKSKSGQSTASSSGTATPAIAENAPEQQNSAEQSSDDKAAALEKIQRRPATERQMERERLLQMEKERKEREAKELEEARKAEQREARHQKFVMETEQCKRVFRQTPLGEDRHRRRCWLFHTPVLPGLYLEDRWQPDFEAVPVPVKTSGEVTPTASTEEMNVDPPAGEEKMSPLPAAEELVCTRWRHFESVAQFEGFIGALAKRGAREKALKEVLEGQKATIVSSIKKSAATLQAAAEVKTEDGEDNLKQSFKDDLQEMVEHLYRGGLGGPSDMDIFEARLSSANTLQELGSLLLEVESFVQPRFMQGVLCPLEVMEKMIAVAVADNKPKPKKVKCCVDQWRSSVENPRTLSRLHLLQAILDECIQWHKSAENARCKICRKKSDDSNMLLCDECNQGFHLYCLRPALSRIPSGHWACPSCQPLNARRSSRGNWCYAEESSDSEEEEEDDEDEDEENESGSSSEMSGSEAASDEEGESDGEDLGDANDDACFTCSSGGELLMCDFCPRSFHLECHVPPLRRTPRGKFKCCICKDPKLAIGRTRAKSALLQGRGGSKATAQKSQRGRPTRSGRKRVRVAYSDDSSDEEVTVAKRGRSRRAAIESSSSEAETTPEKSWEERNGRSLMRGKRAHSLSSQPPTKRRDQRSVSISEDSGRRGGRSVQDLKALSDIIKDLLRHDSAWPFAAPVSLKEVPDYLEVVENPMDLGTIRNKFQRIEYDTCAEVLDDIQRVFINCDKYNQKSSEVGAEGMTLERFFLKQLRRNLPEQSKYYKAVYG